MKKRSRAITVALITVTSITVAACAEPSVETGRDPETIRAVVRQRVPEITSCYDELLEQDPEAEGRVVVRFVVQAAGGVSEASIEVDELASVELEQCMVSVISSWRFPEVEGDGETTISYPFIFRPRAGSTAPRSEGLDRQTIRSAFAEARGDFQRCYRAGLEQDPELEGRVAVHLTIDEGGAVSGLDLDDSTLENEAVAACLAERLSAMDVPAHDEGEVTVTYPLVFQAPR